MGTVESKARKGPMTLCKADRQKWATCKHGESPTGKLRGTDNERCPFAVNRGTYDGEDVWQCGCLEAQKELYKSE